MTEPTYYEHLDDDPLHLDAGRLNPIVRQILNDDRATVTTWENVPLHGIAGGVGGNQVMLLHGEALLDEQPVNWQVVLKIITAQPIDSLTGPHYWLREVEVYRSGFADSIPGNLFVPKCYRLEQPTENVCWLWLEYVEQTTPDNWDDAAFIRAARYLGQLNGGYLQTNPVPVQAWMSQDWHRRNLKQIAPAFENFKTAMNHPLYQQGFPADSHTSILDMWDKQERYLVALDNVPQTICHYDAFRNNLLVHHDEIAIIDWTFVGVGPLGSDIATMLWVSFVFNCLNAARMDSLYEPVFESYLAGLQDAGWDGDVKQVRLGYAVSFPVRVLISAGYDTLLFLNESRHPIFERIVRYSMHDYMTTHVAPVHAVIDKIMDEVKTFGV